MLPYEDALDVFVSRYKGPIAFLFGTEQDHVSRKDLKTMLEYSMGIQLQNIFEFKGGFGSDTLKELQKLPREMRSTEIARKSLERAEFKHVQNKPLTRITTPTPRPNPNPLANHLANWRKLRMRKEMRELAQSSLAVERQMRQLTVALERYRHSPSHSHKSMVSTAVMGLNRALVKSHARARVAGAWAIRAGFHSKSAGRALNHLYFSRARRLEKSTARLDVWLAANGFKTRVSPGISRRRNILEFEMEKAIEMSLSNPRVVYGKQEREISLDGPHG